MNRHSCAMAWLLVLGALPACGSGDSGRSAPGSDAGTGGATASGGRASGGATASGGRASGGTSTGGAGTGGAGTGGSAAGGTDAGPPDASADALPDAPTSVDASLDAADSAALPDAVAEGGPVPVIDAGLGCVGSIDAPLTPAQAGLPTAGLALWLRADRGIYKTTADAVCAWVDQSGGDRVFQGSVAARPVWDPAGASSLPAVRFRTGQGLSVGDVLGLPAQSPRSFIAVQTLANTTARFAAIMQGASGTSGTYVNLDTNPFQTVGSREGVYVTNNAYDSSLATSTATRLHVFTVAPMVVGTPLLPLIHYRVDSTELTLTRTPGGLGNGNFESFLGNFTAVGVGQGASDVMLSEVLVYDRVLAGAELTAVESALSARYGIN